MPDLNVILDDLGAEITRLSDQAAVRANVDALDGRVTVLEAAPPPTGGGDTTAIAADLADLRLNIIKLANGPRTPKDVGITESDRAGGPGIDVTPRLQKLVTDGIRDGDKLDLGPGQYQTSDTIYAVTTWGHPLLMRGAGGSSQIVLNTKAKHVFVVEGPGWQSSSNGYLEHLMARSAAIAPPPPVGTELKAGFLFKTMACFHTSRLIAYNVDVGFDLVDNPYDLVLDQPICPRGNDPVGIGINFREGPQSGSDIHVNVPIITAWKHALNFQGGGGNYKIIGGQIGTAPRWAPDQWKAAYPDDGVINLGWNATTQTPHGGLSGVYLAGVSVEGFAHQYAVVTHADFIGARLLLYIYNPDSQANRALGVAHYRNLGNSSTITWEENCTLGGHFGKTIDGVVVGANDAAGMMKFTGASSPDGNITEHGWHLTDYPGGFFGRNGVRVMSLPRGLGALAGHPTRGGWRGAQMIGGKLHRYVDAKPTSGDWSPGDKAWLNQPTATVDGWSCRSTSPLTFGTIKLA